MKQVTELMVYKFSRKVLILAFICFLSSGVTGGMVTLLEVTWKWLSPISTGLFAFSAVLFMFSGISPGLLVVLRTPWLAHAWLQGARLNGRSYASWDELSNTKRFWVVFYSIVISVLVLITIAGLIINSKL